MERIFVDEMRFIDEYGRHRIFNGGNYVDKGSFWGMPDIKNHYLTDIEYVEPTLKNMSKSGFNIVRFGVSWEAIEPQPGVYDEKYIDYMESFADLCEKYGLYFFIDMHQDLYSHYVNGNGAPKWACFTDGAKVKPMKPVWAVGYFWHKETHNCFDNFWNNRDVDGVGVQTRFINMWVHLAERFKDHPAFFGFDFFNEPYIGKDGGKVFKKLMANLAKTIITERKCKKFKMLKHLLKNEMHIVVEAFDDPKLFRKVTKVGDELVRKFDEECYSPFINSLTKAVRQVTDKGIIFMEGTYYTNIGIPFCAPPATVDGVREPQQCYSPHTYDIFVDTPTYDYASNSRVWSIFETQKKTGERLHSPIMVSEWGGFCLGTKWLDHIDFLFDKFDENMWSQAYYTIFDSFYAYDFSVLEHIIRPAPIAVCGKIKEYRHNREENTFEIEYSQDKEYNVPTVLFAHKSIDRIETDGEYKIIPIANTERSKIEIKTSVGEHKTKIYFK